MWSVLGASGQLYLTCTALVISGSLPSNCKRLSIWLPTLCSLTKFHGNVVSRHEFLGHAACLWGTWAVAEDGQECHRRLTRCRRQADECGHCNQQPLSIDIQWFTAFLGNDPLERCNMFVVHAKLKLSSCHLLVPLLVKSILASLLWTTGVPSASLQHTPPSFERDSINQKPHPRRFCCRVQKTYRALKATSWLSALGLACKSKICEISTTILTWNCPLRYNTTTTLCDFEMFDWPGLWVTSGSRYLLRRPVSQRPKVWLQKVDTWKPCFWISISLVSRPV